MYILIELLGGIRGSGLSTRQMICDPQHIGNPVLPRHAADALRSDVGIHANGRDKQCVLGSAAKDLYDGGASIGARERGLGNAHYRHCAPQSLIQMGSETWSLERGQPYIAIDYNNRRQDGKQTKHRHKAGQLTTKEAARLVRLYRINVSNERRARRFGFPRIGQRTRGTRAGALVMYVQKSDGHLALPR